MALILADRVQQTGTANTTVSFTLSGSVTGFQSFAAVGNGNTTFYAATDASGNWESGLGTYATSGPTLTRTTVYSSSNSGSAVTFSGTVNVFVTYPSSRSVNLDASGNVGPLGTIASGTWNGSTIPAAYGGTGVTASSGASSVVLRDANQNVVFNNFIQGTALTTAAAGTTVLTVASARTQILVGSTTQTYQLPDATTLALGQSFIFVNASSGALTVQNGALGTIDVIPSGGASQLGAVSIATVAGTWGIYSFLPGSYNFNNTSATFNNATISDAVWNGTTIATGYGGTGLTTFAAANNALYSTSASALVAGTLPIAAGGIGATSLAGASIATYSGTETLTNKRIDPRVVSAASASSLTPSIATADIYAYTALAANLTINAPTGTPVDGNKLIFRILDNGTARALDLTAYTAVGVTLPTTTVANKTTYVGVVYNAYGASGTGRWDAIAVTTQA
jgi:hypothetical protein